MFRYNTAKDNTIPAAPFTDIDYCNPIIDKWSHAK